MKLAHSLSKKVYNSSSGNNLNAYKIDKRRNTIFFSELLSGYFQILRKHEKEKLREIIYKWNRAVMQAVVPETLKQNVPNFFNKITKPIWVQLGSIDGMHSNEKEDIFVSIENETITACLNETYFIEPLLEAIIDGIKKRKSKLIKSLIEGKKAEYHFSVSENEEPESFAFKSKDEYLKKNQIKKFEGFSTSDALSKGFFNLNEKNQLFFRSKRLVAYETTLYQLLSIYDLHFEDFLETAENFYANVFDQDSKKEKIALTGKNLFEAMGWGKILIKADENFNKIKINVHHLPYGIQKEKDSWKFLETNILAFLRVINPELELIKSEKINENLLLKIES